MKKRKISFQIILRISAIILIICTTLSLVSVVLFKKVLTEQVMSSMIKSRDDGAKLIEMAISSYIKEVDAVAQRYDIRSMDWNIQKPVLQSEAKRIGFECFQVSDISGNAITTRNESLNIGGYSYFGQVLAGESCISDVSYEERLKKMVVVVNSPIRNENGEIIGVLSGVADASFTNDIVNSIDLDYDGEVFVINDAGYKMAGVDFIGKKALENNADAVGEPHNGHVCGCGSRFIAAEPASCPKLTRGKFQYDFADEAGYTPMLPMYTLGHKFAPANIHAGGLRYHGAGVIVSQLLKDGLMEAVDINQLESFDAGVLFAQAEGIIPAPESCHAIAATVREALKCKETGEEKVILFCLSGHGLIDMASYDKYLAGDLVNYQLSDEDIQKNL